MLEVTLSDRQLFLARVGDFVRTLGCAASEVEEFMARLKPVAETAQCGADFRAFYAKVKRNPVRMAWNASFFGERKIVLTRIIAPHLKGLTLDFACGTGLIARALQDEGHVITVWDRFELLTGEMALEPGLKRFEYETPEQFPTDSVDTVLISTMLHHICDPSGWILHAVRAARKRVVVVENTINDTHTPGYHALLDYFQGEGLNDLGEYQQTPCSFRTAHGWESELAAYGRVSSSVEHGYAGGVLSPHHVSVCDLTKR